MDRPWKERITITRDREQEKRGVVLAKTEKDRKARLQEIESRGGSIANNP